MYISFDRKYIYKICLSYKLDRYKKNSKDRHRD